MPDWTYHTVFRPLLFRLGPDTGRSLALGAMGRLARLPLGRRVIQLMGHMSPDGRLAVERDGLKLASRVGLGCRLDPQLLATGALAEFGFGFLEIGPITLAGNSDSSRVRLDKEGEGLIATSPQPPISVEEVRRKLDRSGALGQPVFARIEPASIAEARQIVDALPDSVAALIVPVEQLDFVLPVFGEGYGNKRIVYAAVDAQAWQSPATQNRCVQAIRDQTAAGVVVTAPVNEGDAVSIGKPEFEYGVQMVQIIRAAVGPGPTIIAGAGVHSPADALDSLEAGADLVQVDTGLIFAGPGLPKRINEALLYRQLNSEPQPVEAAPRKAASESWFWAFLMGLSMLGGGLLAMAIAATRVVLPYDEMLAGLTRDEMVQLNPRLLPFMQHDRVTLAGTMLAIGVLYMTLALWGIRRGVHWAYMAVVVSAFAGFFSFFSFLGFGYFDPFHAFVTAILFQFLLLAMHARLPARHDLEPPGLWNDRRWQANHWGQLLFVIQGAALLAAGLTISTIGMTSVFVPEDLEFMQTSAEELFGAHPRLVPLVAHDRATFGGMLMACGIATLLPAVWGFARGQAWLWWSLMTAGTLAYCATMQVHWAVGYHSLKHLLPAMGGLTLLWAGGLLSYSYLAAPDAALDEEWRRRLSRD